MEKIIERVQKLLNLAGNNPNENEAAAAIEKAHAILAEHNLSMQAIKDHQASTGNAEDDERGALNTETNFSEKYYAWLWSAVAKAHFCKLVKCRPDPHKRETVYTLIGRRVNAIVAAQLAMYLCQTVRRLANEAAKAQGRKDHAFKNAFIAGACNRLYYRISEMNLDKTPQQSGAAFTNDQKNALVLWTGEEEAANNAFAQKLYGKALRTTKARDTRHDGAGYRAGYAAGEKVSLAQQVGAAAPAKQLEK